VECFGQLCPPGTRCVVGLEQCAAVEQIQACEGASLEDGAACRYGDQYGVCQKGVCAVGCGDGLQLDDEVCDGANFGDASCGDFGFYAGSLSCSASCDSIETEDCVGYCGDGEVNGPEYCDTTTLTPGCAFINYDRGTAECGMSCQWPTYGCALNGFRELNLLSSPTVVNDIGFLSPGRAMLAGADGMLEVIGDRIRPVVTESSAAAQALWVLNENVAFATTAAGEILRLVDGKWVVEPGATLHTDTKWSDVTGLDESRVWAIANENWETGEPSKLIAYDGTSWSEVALPGTDPAIGNLVANEGANGVQLWAVGRLDDGDDLIHVYEGGTWKSFGGQDAYDLNILMLGLYAASPTDVYATEMLMPFVSGTVWHMHFDGAEWSARRLTDPVALPLAMALSYDDSAATWTDESVDAGSAGGADVPVPGDTDDALYIASDSPFTSVTVEIETSGVGGSGVWEYWNGSQWSSLEPVNDFEDGTSALTAAPGAGVVSFSPPVDWANGVVNGSASAYFVRFRVTAAYSTPAVVEEVRVAEGPSLPGYFMWSAVGGTGPNNVFASNAYVDFSLGALRSVGDLWHFDGTRWEQIESYGSDHAAMSIGPGGGLSTYLINFAAQNPALRRFDGSAWRQVSTGEDFPSDYSLSGAAHVGGTSFIATSNYDNDGYTPADPEWVPYLWSFDPAKNWEPLPFPGGDDGVPMNDAWSPDGRTVFAVGNGVILVRFGGSWLRFDLPGAPTLRAVHGSSATDAYAVGDGVVLHFDGASWTEELDVGSVSLGAIFMADDGTTFAAGTDCTLLVRDRGTWSSFAPALPCRRAEDEIVAVWAADGDTVHALLPYGIHVFDNGQWKNDIGPGTLNEVYDQSESLTATELFGFDSNEVFTFGQTLGHYDGSSWRHMSVPGATGIGADFPWIRSAAGDRRSIHIVGWNGEIWTLTRLWPWTCASSEVDCDNRMDDDCDGLFDGEDPECAQ